MTLSRGAGIAIVVMRVVIGWHFLYEGLAKLQAPAFSAAGYLQQSRGPFAPFFRSLAADPNVLPWVNQVTMWGLVAVGLGLVLGCFTRLASLGGIVLLLMFYLCNPPFVGYFYAVPTEGSYLVVNKNLVELCALVVVFLTRSGHIAGLDRIIHGLVRGRSRLAEAPAATSPSPRGTGA